VTTGNHGPGEDDAADRSRLYLAVIGVETLVIAALWAFGWYFGS
jgi:hypothetical protein